MNKSKLPLLLILSLFFILANTHQALAMYVVADENGYVHFYEGQVLGDDDQTEEEEEDEEEKEDEEERKEERREEKKNEIKTEVKSISPYQKKQIEFKREDDGRYKIEIQDGKSKLKIQGRDADTNPTKIESFDTDSVNLSLPIKNPSPTEIESRRELLKKRLEMEIESENDDLTEDEKVNQIKEKSNEIESYQKELSAKRTKSKSEKIELKNSSESGELELQMGDVKAKLSGANFSYDQESGLVSITTPSGTSQTLTHLPDEAVARMAAQGFFVDSDQQVELEATNEEEVKYKVKSKKNKKFLGIIDRQVDTEVVLDDLTGEVSENEISTTNFWSNLLNRLTY